MNIIHLILKEIKQSFRDRKSMVMMTLFPIILIVVLGAALKSNFSDNIDIGTPKVLYKIESKSTASEEFKKNFIDKGKDFNIDFEEAENIDEAKKELISRADYACILVVGVDSKIQLYKNDKETLKAGLVESILDTYVQRYNSISEIAKLNPKVLTDIMQDTNTDFTAVNSVNKKAQPSSLDYYAVAMLTLIIMYGTNTGLYGIAGEKNLKTRDRILASPVKKYEFLVGKTLGGIFATTLQVIIVIAFSKYVLKTNWGEDIFTIFLIVLSLIIMAISLGVGLGFIFKKENVASGILNFVIPVMCFLAGAYVPIEVIGNHTFESITYLSPLRWTNKAIFQIIYNSDYSKVFPAITINISIAAVFLIICSILFRREGE
jgi:ABC-2 type transport system permease protein